MAAFHDEKRNSLVMGPDGIRECFRLLGVIVPFLQKDHLATYRLHVLHR